VLGGKHTPFFKAVPGMSLSQFDLALRRRLERLWSGPFQVNDLDHLFLGLRERFYSREAFLEIGHFVAHAGERERGIVTERAKHFFTHMRFTFERYRDQSAPYSGEYLCAALAANLNLASDETLKEWGVSRHDAASLLGKVKRKLRGKFGAPPLPEFPYKAHEVEILSKILGTVFANPAFNGELLFKEFCDVLVKNKILQAHEMGRMDQLAPVLSLYGAFRLHGCSVRLESGWSAELRINQHGPGETIAVNASAVMNPELNISVSAPFYTTIVQPTAGCTDELLSRWEEPNLVIELTDSGRLSII
jgi:hypothetical protein